MVDMVQRDDDDDEDAEVDAGAADKSAVVDEAMSVAIDEVAAVAAPEVIGSGN
jgi:hypothetical protein